MKKKGPIICVILIIIIGVCISLLAYKGIIKTNKKSDIKDSKENTEYGIKNEIEGNIEVEKPEEKKKVEIFKGNDRTIAVMIDNSKDALPQGGLNDAYMVYEIIVEGGESRLMALFKGKELDKIGPVRSARHYFLDYALENDAIYVHFGWSPKAKSDISKLKVENINGIYESDRDFWRERDKRAPHNVATGTKDIIKIATRKDYSLKTYDEGVLKYTVDEVNLEKGEVADLVTIPYSDYNEVKYEYNPETKRYQRYSKDVREVDWTTKEDVTTKNIIITFARNTRLDDPEKKDRQDLHNIGKLEGYYITNGKAIPITCEKKSRKEKTIYKDLDGNEIKVNDGNTFVQICPINAKVKIESIEDKIDL